MLTITPPDKFSAELDAAYQNYLKRLQLRRQRKERAQALRDRRKLENGCGCGCQGCGVDRHCLASPCVRKRNRRSTEQCTERTPSGRARWIKMCGCACGVCRSNYEHCLQPPCDRKRNKRRQADIDAGVQPFATPPVKQRPRKPRPTAPRPSRPLSAHQAGSSEPKAETPMPTPKRLRVRWYVYAVRGRVIRLRAQTEAEARSIALSLETHGWTGGEYSDYPMVWSRP